jgi:signal transduction histidine kinase
MLTVFAAGISAAVYRHRISAWQQQQETLRINECLALAQSRVLLSENAASLGRLAATLVHELNSPLGALTSGVETLIALSARQASAPAEQQPRLVALQRDLRRSIAESLARLHEIVSRVEHFTGLDEADFQCINLNELLRDVAALFETQVGDTARIEFDLEPVPDLTCQPQQLSAVFSSLLQNAAASSAGGKTRIGISSRNTGTHVEIRLEDSGKGISPEELAMIFEPGFKVSGNRMATGNWSLFGCRQIVQGHGGEIYISSELGKGSAAVIRLPL